MVANKKVLVWQPGMYDSKAPLQPTRKGLKTAKSSPMGHRGRDLDNLEIAPGTPMMVREPI